MDASPPDAAPPDATCGAPPMAAFVVATFALPSQEQGFDLDGDGSVDNMLGNMPAAARDSAGNGIQGLIDRGEANILMLVTDWADPPSPDDPDVHVYLTWAMDSDSPWDASDNLSGNESFYLPLVVFDLDCNLRNPSDDGMVVSGVVSANAAAWEFPYVNGSGSLAWLDTHLECTLDPTLTSGTCVLGAVWPFCSLAASPFPGDIGGTVLDALINDESLSSSISVDVDRDGDGFEKIVGDGVSVMKCIDGDGTEIQDRGCACDPRIVDGYTFTARFELVHGRVVGVQ